MKAIATFLTFISIVIVIDCKAQGSSFSFGIVMPESSSTLNEDQLLRLRTKLSQMVSNSQVATVGFNNSFVVYPVVSVGESNVVHGGMQKLTATTLELAFFVKQYTSNITFNTMRLDVQGSGSNQSQAVNNAISRIDVNSKVFQHFIVEAKQKIISYYNANCSMFVQKAKNLVSINDFEQSLALLNSVPIESSNCYSVTQQLSLTFYKQYQTKLCAKNITTAKALISNNNLDEAIAVLELIDPMASCAGEVSSLISQIATKVEKRDAQSFDLEKRRITAIQEIAKSYYSRSISNIRYSVLVQK